MKSLYRKAALEGRNYGFSNPVIVSGSISAGVMLVGICLVAAGFVAFGLQTDYTRSSVVPGFLTPQDGSVTVFSPTDGQVLLDVRNGQHVERGQRLAQIISDSSDSAGLSVAAIEISNLQDGVRLNGERHQLLAEQMDALSAQRMSALSLFDASVSLQSERLSFELEILQLLEDQLERSNTLLRENLNTQSATAAARQQYLIIQQSVLEARSKLTSAPTERRLIELEWDARALILDQNGNELEREARSLQTQLAQAQARLNSGIFAPISGTVTVTRAQQSESIASGEHLFEVTPTGSELVAVLFAPSSAIGFVRSGDTVQLRYDAFPFREHGVFEGEVLEIDQTSQLPGSIETPITLTESVYRIVCRIAQNPASKSGRDIVLSSGMALEASIIIDEKPLLFWLLDPIL